jgi:hypothetical protein
MSVEARSADLPGQWISIRALQWSKRFGSLLTAGTGFAGERDPT